MSNNCDESLLDHLAGFIIFLSSEPSFWYSLDSSYDHEFHLSQQLGMSRQAYEYILMAAGLGIKNKWWGITKVWVIWGWCAEIMMCWHGWGCTIPLTASSPHPYCTNRKCLSTFISMLWIGIWVHPCIVTQLINKLTRIWVICGWWGEVMMCWHGKAVQFHSLLLHIHVVYI